MCTAEVVVGILSLSFVAPAVLRFACPPGRTYQDTGAPPVNQPPAGPVPESVPPPGPTDFPTANNGPIDQPPPVGWAPGPPTTPVPPSQSLPPPDPVPTATGTAKYFDASVPLADPVADTVRLCHSAVPSRLTSGVGAPKTPCAGGNGPFRARVWAVCAKV